MISIIIPNYNGVNLLKENLPMVIKACKKWNSTGWEIIVSDDASTDSSVEYLVKHFPIVKVIINPTNVRFAENCNIGVKAARGEIIILLNSDVKPEINFIKPLLEPFKDNQVFGVGCKEEDSVKGHKVYSGRGIMKFARGLAVHRRADNMEETTTSWVSGGSGAFDRKKWLELGGMDRLFRPAYEEDRDLSYVAQKHGWKILFEPKAQVFHHHEVTNRNVFSEHQMKKISFKNQFLFVWKNITDTNYLIQHLFWLPYHLSLTNIRSGGAVLPGFIQALKQLPEVRKRRIMVKKLFIKKDKELI